MSTDMYAPSMPHLPELLGTSAEMVQLTLALNALAFGFAQLIIGPMSDRFGRRPIFIAGLFLFGVFSLACALAVNIEQLIVARIFQGATASVEAVIVLAVISDLFEKLGRPQQAAGWRIILRNLVLFKKNMENVPQNISTVRRSGGDNLP